MRIFKKPSHLTGRISTALGLTIILTLGMLANPTQQVAHANETTATQPAATQPRDPSPATTQLWNEVKADYQAVTATQIGEHIGLRKRATSTVEAIKVYKENHNNQQPTPQQIQDQLAEFAVKDVVYHTAVAKLQADIDRLLPLVIETLPQNQRNTQTLRENKLQILAGLAYLYRYYDFKIGQQRVLEDILFNQSAPADTTTNAYQRLLNIGAINGNLVIGPQTTEQYAARISRYTGYPTIVDYIEHKLTEGGAGQTPQQWLAETSKAVIYDTEKRSLWTKFKEDEIMRDYLLPLLNLSDDSLYVGNSEFSIHTGLTSLYGGGQNPQLRQKLKETVDSDQKFTDFWMRMSHNPKGMNANGHVIVNDTWADQTNLNQPIASRWARPYKTGADAALLELYHTMLIRQMPQQVGAVAAGTHINYYIYTALSTDGIATYAHEMTHIYDQSVWFNNQGRRASMRVEDYARGLFETENNSPNRNKPGLYTPFFNLNLAYELDESRIQNRSPERFKTREDVAEYARGLMDVLHSLDAMEALESLKLPAADKALLFNKVQAQPNTRENWMETWHTYYENSWKDVFTKLNEAEAQQLNTIDDLVDKQILSAKVMPKGIASSAVEVGVNQYVVVPLFEPVYAGLTGNNQGTGSFMFRRNAYDILGEYGWDNGFIAYLSGKYSDEQTALAGILTQHDGNLATFKKDMYQRRVDKFTQMKPAAGYTDAQQMQAAMKAAVAQDLAAIKANQGRSTSDPAFGVNAVRDLKMRILTSYLNSTDDFRTSIYKQLIPVERDFTAQVNLTQNQAPQSFTATEFKLRVAAGADNPEGGVQNLPAVDVNVPADGETALGKWKFTKPGTYTFTVSQAKTDNARIIYDPHPVKVTVKVSEPGASATVLRSVAANTLSEGTPLNIEVTYTKNDKPVEKIEFHNEWRTYRYEHTPGPINVTFTENGQPKSADGFDFKLNVVAAAENPAAVAEVPAQAVSAVNGQFTLPQYVITEPGTYKFTYSQANLGAEHVTYDGAILEETLEATVDPQDPTRLTVVSTWTKAGQPMSGTPSFANTYAQPQPVETFKDTVESVEIPIEETEIEDSTAYLGVDTVDFPGEVGLKQVTKRQRYVDGVPQGEPEVISETIVRNMKPRVIRKGVRPNKGEDVTVVTETIPVETVYEDDPQLQVGVEEEAAPGRTGEVEVRTVQPTWNGQPQGEAVVTRTVLVEMQPKRVRRGTKALVLTPATPVKPTPTPPPAPSPDPTPAPAPEPAPKPETRKGASVTVQPLPQGYPLTLLTPAYPAAPVPPSGMKPVPVPPVPPVVTVPPAQSATTPEANRMAQQNGKQVKLVLANTGADTVKLLFLAVSLAAIGFAGRRFSRSVKRH